MNDLNNKYINFYCPDWANGFRAYMRLLDLEKDYPFIFRPNRRIKKIFGCPYNMIWNGGGMNFGESMRIPTMDHLAAKYKEAGISLQFTLTNSKIEERDLYDRYCNAVLKHFETGTNEVLVVSPLLEEYVRKTYPKYKVAKSIITTSPKNNPDYHKDLTKYNTVVLARRDIFNIQLLESFTPEEKSRLELLCNDPCSIECPRLYEHYERFAEANLYERSTSDECLKCNQLPKPFDKYFREHAYQKYQIKPDDIMDWVRHGFTEFKIAGRGGIWGVADHVVPYLIKPEYQLETALIILKETL